MKQQYDTIIIGAGPAGLSLALGLLRSNKRVAVIERGLYGGTLNDTEFIENVLGIPKTAGMVLAQDMYTQVKDFDNLTYINETVTGIQENEERFKVDTSKDTYTSHTVAVATGVRHKKLGVKGEEEYLMNISSCATCDKMFYKDKDVIMVGGGDSAYEGAIELSDVANKVTLLYYKDEKDLKAEPILQDRFNERPNTRALFNAETREIFGEDDLAQGVAIGDPHGYNRATLPTDGVFVNVGVEPNTEFMEGDFLQDGYIEVEDFGSFRVKGYPDGGFYALGDVVYENERQVAKALGDSTVVSKEINKFLDNI